MTDTTDLLAPSADYQAMQPYWQMVADIQSGPESLRNPAYMPAFPAESRRAHEYRMANSVLVDIFDDIVDSLASKPFTREVALAGGEHNPVMLGLIEDIDRADNHIHVLAQDVFWHGIAYGLDWLIVDYTSLPEGATLDDERRMGARPYVVRVSCFDMLEVRSEVVGGREIITYARINESDEDTNRVRILQRDDSRAWFEIWEQQDGQTNWTLVQDGAISLGEVPVIPFYTGRRVPGTWQFTLPMRRVANLQIEHYLQETNLKIAKEKTAFPMLVGQGVEPPVDKYGKPAPLDVGPGAVLYAPPADMGGSHGTWSIIEPTTTSLEFLAEERDRTEQAMRELGRQPLTAGTAGLTQVAAAFASQRASSAVQAWTFLLKDVLENALAYCSAWLHIDEAPAIYVNSDFAIEIGSEKAPEILVQLTRDGLISRRTLLAELKRRGILSEEVDEEAEAGWLARDVNVYYDMGGSPEDEML